jgi:ComF family protein
VDKSPNKFKEFTKDLLFPKSCLGCQKEGLYLCDDCRTILDINEFDYCLCSKNPIRFLPEQKMGTCNRCQNRKLSGLYCALSYKDKQLTKNLIYQFKYPPHLKDLAKTLASILIEHFVISGKNTNEIWENSILIPVPLDKNKLKNRGYNQAEELAKELSKILQIPVVSDVLTKIKLTKAQAESNKEEREKNLLNAFCVNKNLAKSDLAKFYKVFLVDDVYTTGSTMEECASVLRQAGAKQVWGICLARED